MAGQKVHNCHEHHCSSSCAQNGKHISTTDVSCISLVPIFNHLEKEKMDEIKKVIQSVFYKKGEIIYSAGEQSDSLYIINSGKIKIYRLSESGKEQLIRILTSGDFTGELALFTESVHESYAEAMEDSYVCIIKRSELQKFLIKYPSISLEILSEFAKRLESSEQQTTLFATEKVETRLALFLAKCVDAKNSSMEFILPMSRKDLASYLGTTPETISRKLTAFEDAGIIKQLPRRKIRILDLDSLLTV